MNPVHNERPIYMGREGMRVQGSLDDIMHLSQLLCQAETNK